MTHITPETLERLFHPDRAADVQMCVHALESNLHPPAEDGSRHVVTRLVGHLVVDLEDGLELPEEFCLVVDLPMSTEILVMTSGHFSDSMESLTDRALEALLPEDDQS